MTDENLYTAPDGKRYRAVESSARNCLGCALKNGLYCAGRPCSPGTGRTTEPVTVIWVPADAPAAPAPSSLRDWFAGMALEGLVASAFDYMADDKATDAMTAKALGLMKDIGEGSYRIADAMLKAREEAPHA